MMLRGTKFPRAIKMFSPAHTLTPADYKFVLAMIHVVALSQLIVGERQLLARVKSLRTF